MTTKKFYKINFSYRWLILIIILLFFIVFKYVLDYYEYYKQQSFYHQYTNICILIPLCPKHYYYAENFVKKNNGLIDIYFIFSNKENASSFPLKKGFFPIIIPPDFQIGGCIVTEKKFYGLRHLQNSKYDFFIVCDAEIDIVPENYTKENIVKKVENIFENRCLYGSLDDTYTNIASTSADVFHKKDQDRLKIMTHNFQYYMWWADLPVYKKDHLQNFFSTIRTTDLNWSHFDHLIYTYYLLLYRGFKMIDTTKLTGKSYPIESYCDESDDNLEKLLMAKYGFGWVNRCFYNKKKEFLTKNVTFLIYHLDR